MEYKEEIIEFISSNTGSRKAVALPTPPRMFSAGIP